MRHRPGKLAPEAISIRLFGPGVAELTKAKTAKAERISKLMMHVYGRWRQRKPVFEARG